jgi:hypothetical protein
MTERPILMSAPMVRAIRGGTKTQTRRIVMPGRSQHWLQKDVLHRSPRAKMVDVVGVAWAQFATPMAGQMHMGIQISEWSPLGCVRCPYGRAGDWLWVRETWAPRADGFAYAADPAWNTSAGGRWHPSIHMPRCASRITLEITEVRVQRLQDISEEDAKSEGLSFVADGCARFGVEGVASSWCDCPVTAYAALWESINGSGAWDANPWVWAIDFAVQRSGQQEANAL